MYYISFYYVLYNDLLNENLLNLINKLNIFFVTSIDYAFNMHNIDKKDI